MVPRLQEDNIILKALEGGQAEELASIANNRKIWLNVRNQFPHPYLLQDAVDFIKMYKQRKDNYSWAIHEGDILAGMIGIHPAKDVYAHSAEIGYWLGEDFWGRGIMSKAVRLVLANIFTNTELTRVYAGLYDYNIGSKKVLEKVGFKYEGTGVKAVIKDGKNVDELRYAILKEDFLKR